LKEALKYLSQGRETIKVEELSELIRSYSKHPEVLETVLKELEEGIKDGEVNIGKVVEMLS
jgi:hypothetical protein